MQKTFKAYTLNVNSFQEYINKYFINSEIKDFTIGASIGTIKNELLKNIKTLSDYESGNESHIQAIAKAISRYNTSDIVLKLEKRKYKSFFGKEKQEIILNIKY